MAYSLTLHFTAGDRSVSVLKEGYRSGNQVGAKGRHATQTCSLSIRSYEVSAMLLQEEAPLIRAELKDDGVIIFQGVVRPYQSVSAKNNTENLFSLQLMDDTEVLENTAITEAVDFLDKTLSWCVGYLYDLAGIPETLVTPPELNAIDVPFFSLNPDKYAKVSDQLEAMLWEYGYDYKFSGTNCNIIKTWTDGTGLEAVNVRNTLKVQRNDNWSDGVKVNYGVMEICRQIPLAQWKEDVADLQPWRYVLPWSYSTSSGHVTRTISYDPFFTGNKPSNFKTEYILGAQNCQARSVQNCTILGIDPHAQSVAVEFSWSNLRQNYVWGNPIADWPHFSIYGDIIYAIPGDYQENITGDKPDEFTLEYIRSKEGAQAFAEREYKRAKCAPVTFSFQALENYEAGSFRRLTDSVTGIDAVIRILSCSMNADGIYSVTAESADYINISVETEELQLRDALDVGTEIILEVSADSVGEGSSVTVTASGRLLDIIESQDSDTFIYRWELNGEAVPAWDDLTEITATFAELGDDDNVFKFSVYHVEGDTQVLLGFALASTLKYIEGKDGDSAEIQYAIGDSITDPPQGDMFWGGEEMLWGQPDMAWDEAEYSDDVPDMERARYIWMRTRVGDGEWQYTRLTGSTSWDPEGLGVATGATGVPTQSKEGLPLVAGDFFIAGETFTEDGNEYKQGYTYEYTGSSWSPLDLSDPANAEKGLKCLGDLMASGINVSDSTASIYGWFQNLIAQNAVINQLVAEVATLKQLIVTGDINNDAITTSKATEATSLASLVTSVQNYYLNGVVQGTCPQIQASVVASLLPLGLSNASGGSITIDGVTITASLTSPIQFERTETSLTISQDGITKAMFFAESFGYLYYTPSEGYWMTTGRNKAITSDSLYLPTSNGSAYMHDIIPKDSTSDRIGTGSRPFLSGTFTSLTIQTPEQFNYKPTMVSTGTVNFAASTLDTWTNVASISEDTTMIICNAILPERGGINHVQTIPYTNSYSLSTNIEVNMGDYFSVISFRKNSGYIQAKIDVLDTGDTMQARVECYK